MNKNNKLNDLKEQYNSIKIPKELNSIVEKALNEKKGRKSMKKSCRKFMYGVSSIAALALVIGINTSEAMASTLENIPVVGNVIKAINFSNYSIDEDNFVANINVPKIEGLKNKDLELQLNEEFLEQGKALYNDFKNEIEKMEEGHKSLNSFYKVKTDNENILTIGIHTVESQASTDEKVKYYNIDRKNEAVMTLATIFSNDRYIEVISKYIKEEMRKTMKNDESKSYFIDDEVGENFQSIEKDQNFYINENNDLVICFDKYEVAPGYMGLVEFVMPKNIVDSLKQ